MTAPPPRSPPAPQVRAERFRVGTAMLASLLAGRSVYRLVTLATTVLLLPAWGEDRYRAYAAAIATFSWLMALVFTGPEKTVLKLLPRAPRTGGMITDALVAVVWWLPLPLTAGFGLALAVGGGGPAALYLGVAAMLLSIGCTQLLVGLHRARGRPRSDVVTFLTMAVWNLALLVAAAAGFLEPVGFVAAVLAVQLGLNLVLSATLGRPSLRIRHRRGLLCRLGWTVLLLGGLDLFLLFTTAVLFVMLGRSAHAEQVGLLFAVSVVWSAGVNLLLYLLRVYAPQTALRLAGRAGVAGRARAARLAALAAVANTAWLAVVGLVLATTELADLAGQASQILLWSVLLATKAPALALLLWASFVLENTDATAPRLVGVAAVAGLATATVAGLTTIPAWGAAGVIASFAAGELGYAVVVARNARRVRHREARSPESGRQPVPGPG